MYGIQEGERERCQAIILLHDLLTKGPAMRRIGHHIIAIGTSAGGMEALTCLVRQFPPDIRATIFIVQHLAPQATAETLLHRLQAYTKIPCKVARHQEQFQPGTIYIGPSDFHLLIKRNRMLVTKGARENRYRPAIDPLFRSAAVVYGPRVIGVVLTGLLDDGTAGLQAIKQCGGVAVVQDPKDAAYPDMPQSALSNVEVDHCVPLDEMGLLLKTLITRRHAKRTIIPQDVRTEALIAERVLSDVAQVNGLGTHVPYNCPNCGGVLWEMKARRAGRYRCHTGHSFTATALVTAQSEKIEEVLWVAMRMLEERKNLFGRILRNDNGPAMQRLYTHRLRENQSHIERIRSMLLSPDSYS
jgi:two-component system, chemotaxis family, protein-glutamate methylesterase/glutaminase